ncbi:MAG: AbrB/MazE/SpoVT family DNA-binding domain-containing protein [Cyanobium sp.]
MTTVTLSSKGQLTIPRQLRESLSLSAGSRIHVSVHRYGWLVHDPEALFRHHPTFARPMSLEDMNRTTKSSVTVLFHNDQPCHISI